MHWVTRIPKLQPCYATRWGRSCTFRISSITATRRPFRFVRLNDVSHLRSNFTPRVAAILVEVIQGEGGVVELSEEFLKVAQELCRAQDALLIADEIQCGLGRTGRWFAFQRFGLRPDVVVV